MTSSGAQKSAKGIFSLFRESLSGKEQQYTSGSINKAIFLLAVPMILEMLMESLFAVVDIFFVSHLGVDAVATVGLTESVLAIIYSMGIGISMAATALVARRIGEENPDAAAHAAAQTIILTVVISILLSITGLIFAEDILLLLGASEKVVQIGLGYTQWMFGGNIVIMLLYMINGIFRGAGDASMAMRSLWVASALNIVLCPVFIFGIGPIPEFGVTGAAIATNIGRGTGVLYQLYYLFDGRRIIKLARRHFKYDLPLMIQVLKIAAGGTGQFLIASASWIFLVRIVSVFGSNALAGYTIAFRILVFTILPAFGLSNAAATLVGQNLGAKQPERAEKSVWQTAIYNMIFLGLVSLVYFFAAKWIISGFTTDPEVVKYAVSCLQIVS